MDDQQLLKAYSHELNLIDAYTVEELIDSHRALLTVCNNLIAEHRHQVQAAWDHCMSIRCEECKHGHHPN